MDRARLEELLQAVRTTRIAVLGDFCLDAYWTIDPAGSETSIETGKPTQTVRQQRYGLGGAGNVVHNLIDLGVGHVQVIGVLGDDLFGRELRAMLAALGADVAGICTQTPDWDTPVYGKPYVGDEEQSRIDFGAFNQITAATEHCLMQALRAALPSVQAVIVNQQLVRGIGSEALIASINRLVAANPDRIFILDSRHSSEKFEGAILKLNTAEAARLAGVPGGPSDLVPLKTVQDSARALYRRTGRPVFVTRGARGLVAYDGQELTVVPGIEMLTPLDPVGAGDTAVTAIAAALSAGATVAEAAELANLAAAVTVRKLGQCGTATPAEIVQLGTGPDYVYRPELADDPTAARYHDDTEIELIADRLPPGRIEHAIVDHDGTISTLRQGWETIMEPMMVKAILGPRYADAAEARRRKIVEAVRDYIDKSTGVQTIVQMEALVELVRRFGFVPPEQILDEWGYKSLYNASLMAVVRPRLARLERGELTVEDFTIRGAVAFLRMLRDRGVRLYLASGSDHTDVVAEARALGYADLFEGGIYGAVNDARQCSKRMVVDRILRENRLVGPQLVCFGDGPVELRETRKRGGIAVGVASDEVRRCGLNPRKRARLVRAGADLIVPDFSLGPALLEYLFAGPS